MILHDCLMYSTSAVKQIEHEVRQMTSPLEILEKNKKRHLKEMLQKYKVEGGLKLGRNVSTQFKTGRRSGTTDH